MTAEDYRIDPNGGFHVSKDALKVLAPGEKRLMLALFREALVSLKEYFIKKYAENRYADEEAYNWFFNESDFNYIFSFENVCGVLLYNPQAVRQALVRIENVIKKKPDIAKYFLKVDFTRLCLAIAEKTSERDSNQNDAAEEEINAYCQTTSGKQ